MGVMLTPETEVSIVVFAGFPGGDLLAFVLKQPGENWELSGRLRLHVDDKAFGSEDPKYWFRSDGTREILEARIRRTAEMTVAKLGGEIHELPINGSGVTAHELIIQQPWCEFKVVTDTPN